MVCVTSFIMGRRPKTIPVPFAESILHKELVESREKGLKNQIPKPKDQHQNWKADCPTSA